MRPIPLAACAAALVLVTGCGETAHEVSPANTPPTTEVSQHGLAVALPAGWQAAPSSLTPHLTDPREELSVATFPLRYRDDGGCAHMPVSALRDLGPRDAFVTLEERGIGATDNGFPGRPARFGPALGGPSEAGQCAPSAQFTDHWFTFSDASRRFHVLVAFGPDTPAHVRAQAWSILDRLKVDPAVVPDWKFSG